VPPGSVPSFGGTLVPSVCDDVVCPVDDAAPGAPLAALPAPRTDAPVAPGAGLSPLGGWYVLLLPVARVELLRSVPCAAVDAFVVPEGDTGIGVDAEGAGGAGCASVADVEPALRAPSPPRSQPATASIAAVATSESESESARRRAIARIGKSDARSRDERRAQGNVNETAGSVDVASTTWLCVVPLAVTTTVKAPVGGVLSGLKTSGARPGT